MWKTESTPLIAPRARVTHDIGIGEELAQDALLTALERWPEEDMPEHPGGVADGNCQPARHRSPKVSSTA